MKLFRNIRHAPTWLVRIVYWLIKAYARTCRVSIHDPKGWLADRGREPAVAVLWHNRILFVSAFFTREFMGAFSVLVSRSRDGNYVAEFIRLFGLHVVRGSSSKGGVSGLLGLADELRQGRSPILTVDGPRGPKYSVHPGATLLAEHGAPVVAVCVNASSYWQLKSWDNLQIPKPFSKVTIEIEGPERLAAVGREERCEEIRTRLLAITKD